MSQTVGKVIVGDTVSWTNYGALMKLWQTTTCTKCKQKYFDELRAFDKYNKQVYNIWTKQNQENVKN